MSKAYDSVSHQVLEQISYRMGMSPGAWKRIAAATLLQRKRWHPERHWSRMGHLSGHIKPLHGEPTGLMHT